MSARRKQVITGGLVVLAGLLVVGLAVRFGTRGRPMNAEQADRGGVAVADTPCGGTETTLEDAMANAPFQILIPDPSDKGSKIESAWICSDAEYLLLLSSGASVLEGSNTLKDPEREWQDLAAEYPEFSVGTVRGVPASLAKPEPSLGGNGGVDLVEGMVRVTVTGNGEIPLDDLVGLAESLRPGETPSPTASASPTAWCRPTVSPAFSDTQDGGR